MQEIKLKCNKCETTIKVDPGFGGMTVRCSKCGAFNELPKEDEDGVSGSSFFGRPDSPNSDEASEDGLIVAKQYGHKEGEIEAYCPSCKRRLSRPHSAGVDRLACPACGRSFKVVDGKKVVEEELRAVMLEDEPTPGNLRRPNKNGDKGGDKASDSTPPPAKAPQTFKKIINSIGMEFLYVPSDSFMMGSPETEEGRDPHEDRHLVRFTKGYYLQTTVVTQGQWKAIMGDNPSSFKKSDNLPVERVTWRGANEFCESLSAIKPKWWQRLKGKGEVGRKYRLPTEAEWEFACRANSPWPFWTGRRLNAEQANFDGRQSYAGSPPTRYRGYTTNVDRFPANPWGFFDMHGNVAQWCADFYGHYPTQPVFDPTGPEKGTYRVVRGGSWHMALKDCRCAARIFYDPGVAYNDLGFRVAMDLVEEK